MASMGPHVFACGNLSPRPERGRKERLQWGRTFLRAEIIYAFRDPLAALRLQWGRTFLRAEIRILLIEQVLVAIASMGPHVFACGNSIEAPAEMPIGTGFNGAARFCVRKSG